MNFAYCIDDAFNTQCAVSIHSLLNNTDKNISIHILHSEPETFNKYIKIIESKTDFRNINLYKVDTEDFTFPNLINSHVSNATYFRLYLEKYLKKKEVIIYLDADTIIMRNPLQLLERQIHAMRENNFYLGATKETDKTSSNDIFERLELKGVDYFNAGVMILDLDNPKTINLTNELLELTMELGTNIKHWDQDVMNKYFDKNFFQIEPELNFRLDDEDNLPTQDAKILHYLGSNKPWTLDGLKILNSKYYQENYLALFDKNLYHVTTKWKKKTYLDLLVYILTFKLFRKHNSLKIFLSTLIAKKS